MTINGNLAGIGGVIARDAADERRLSRAIVADQPDNLAWPDVEVEVLKRMQAAEGLAERGDTQKGFCPLGHSVHSAGWRWLTATATTMMIPCTTICSCTVAPMSTRPLTIMVMRSEPTSAP